MPDPENLPTLDDVHEAARFLQGHVLRTPVLRSPVLDAIAGVELWLKAENMQHIGAFKARGATLAVGRLSAQERRRGVITYSSGNHAQAVALAARRFGCPAHVAMPTDAPAIKVAAVRALGAAVTFAGTTSDDREREARAIAERTGGVIIPPFDDPHVIAGQGTATLELFEQAEQLDAVIVPVGGGGLVAGACLVAAARGAAVFGAEPVGCDALARSLEQGERVAVQPAATIADGLKPVMVGERNFAIARRHVSRSFRVDDSQLGRTLCSLAIYARTVVEPSGAAAAAVALEGMLPSGPSRVGVLLSGGNVAAEHLVRLLSDYQPHPRRW